MYIRFSHDILSLSKYKYYETFFRPEKEMQKSFVIVPKWHIMMDKSLSINDSVIRYRPATIPRIEFNIDR